MEVPKFGEKMYVHVSNREQAIALLTHLHENGITWGSGTSLMDRMYLDELHTWNYYWFGDKNGLYRSSGGRDGGVIQFEELDLWIEDEEPVQESDMKILFEM